MRRGRFQPLRFGRRHRLFELHGRGLSAHEIATELNIPAYTVRKVIEAPAVQKALQQAQAAVVKSTR